MASDLRYLTVLLHMPSAHMLSTIIGVAPCGYPSALSILRAASLCVALMNALAYSVSAADAVTVGMMVLITSMAPLMVWTSSLLLMR